MEEIEDFDYEDGFVGTVEGFDAANANAAAGTSGSGSSDTQSSTPISHCSTTSTTVNSTSNPGNSKICLPICWGVFLLYGIVAPESYQLK